MIVIVEHKLIPSQYTVN